VSSRGRLAGRTSNAGNCAAQCARVRPLDSSTRLAWGRDAAGCHVWKPGGDPVLLDVESFPLDDRDSPINRGILVDVSHIVPTPPATPETASFPLDDGETCATSMCIALGGRLYIAR
jgi:hypothetical protein